MSEYRVTVPISVTIPVRSDATSVGLALSNAISGIRATLPMGATDFVVFHDKINVTELPDGSPICDEMWVKGQ